MRRFSHYAIVVLLAAGASGCLDFSDRRGAIMSIELCWDEQPGAGFVGRNCVNSNKGTCDRAGVSTIHWTLTRAGVAKPVAEDSQDCTNGFDVGDPPPTPGAYTLSITGTNKDGSVTWEGTCKGLDVLRFDVAYECDVEAP